MYVEASTLAFTDLRVLAARTRVEATVVKPVNRLVEHSLIFPEDVARAIPDMNVPIEDCHLLYSELLLSVARGDSHIIEEAEASYVGTRSMVPRWTNDTEGAVNPAAHHCVHSLARSTSSKEG